MAELLDSLEPRVAALRTGGYRMIVSCATHLLDLTIERKRRLTWPAQR